MVELDLEGRGVLGRGARVQSPPQAGHERAGGHPGLGILAVHGGFVYGVQHGTGSLHFEVSVCIPTGFCGRAESTTSPLRLGQRGS